MGGLQESAVVALRKSNGDVQRAAGEILDQVDSRREAGKDRARQRKLGLTADKVYTRDRKDAAAWPPLRAPWPLCVTGPDAHGSRSTKRRTE